ncbi:hypothetical protein PIIN_09592 [Serendipita indica DSM 11827]|uniref:Uncharacterized protein n=1 Tax=Serendipita indica (strain DSM 11827) TaxID=1109443 RepID=G4TWA9_SERID|nr:hypothetical protein PIIN_09592 [Serendipita indica DSM 11827]
MVTKDLPKELLISIFLCAVAQSPATLRENVDRSVASLKGNCRALARSLETNRNHCKATGFCVFWSLTSRARDSFAAMWTTYHQRSLGCGYTHVSYYGATWNIREICAIPTLKETTLQTLLKHCHSLEEVPLAIAKPRAQWKNILLLLKPTESEWGNLNRGRLITPDSPWQMREDDFDS